MNLIRSDTVGNDLYLLLGTVPPLNSSKCLAINEYNILFGIVPNVEYMGSLPLIDALSNNKETKKQFMNTAEQ